MMVYTCGHEAPLQVNDGLLAPSGGGNIPVDYPCKACVMEKVKAHKEASLADNAQPIAVRQARNYWVDQAGVIHPDFGTLAAASGL